MRADAIVVLGCRILPSGRPTAAAARRAAAAARAYHAAIAPRVIASGGRRWGPQIEAKCFGDALVEAGVPAEAVLQELWSLSTYENAIYTAALCARMGAERVAVVTCAWHMARALANFRALGVDAVPLPAEPGAPAGAWTRARRRAVELVSGWLDRRLLRRSSVLRASALRAAGEGA